MFTVLLKTGRLPVSLEAIAFRASVLSKKTFLWRETYEKGWILSFSAFMPSCRSI